METRLKAKLAAFKQGQELIEDRLRSIQQSKQAFSEFERNGG